MQTLNPQQTEHVHGAGSIDAALRGWYLYSLTGPGIIRPIQLVDTY